MFTCINWEKSHMPESALAFIGPPPLLPEAVLETHHCPHLTVVTAPKLLNIPLPGNICCPRCAQSPKHRWPPNENGIASIGSCVPGVLPRSLKWYVQQFRGGMWGKGQSFGWTFYTNCLKRSTRRY